MGTRIVALLLCSLATLCGTATAQELGTTYGTGVGDLEPTPMADILADPEKFAGRREGSLYNLHTDPGETRNLFSDDRHQVTANRLLASITTWDRSHESIG